MLIRIILEEIPAMHLKDDARNQDDIGENEILAVSFGTSFNDSRVADIKGIEDASAGSKSGLVRQKSIYRTDHHQPCTGA